MTDLVVHVPHASTLIPKETRKQFILSSAELAEEARLSADLMTEVLARAAWPSAEIVEAEVSRLVVDVERYAEDAEETMAAVGRGMIYSRTHDGIRMRRNLSAVERLRLKEKYYDPHWKRLRAAADARVMVDLHSYPVSPWPVETDPTAARPEIDLGTTDGLTPGPWISAVKEHFEAFGYEVGLNTPYAGVIDAGASQAIMIEIRRDIIGGSTSDETWRQLVKCLSQLPITE